MKTIRSKYWHAWKYENKILTPEQKNKFYRENNVSGYFAQLTVSLTNKAIEYIEIQREKDHEKAARFFIELVVKYIDIPSEQLNLAAENFIRLQVKRKNTSFTIKQSDWINNYSPHLGIGNFLLLELQIPDDKNVTEFWKELYASLTINLKDIETCLRSGDWQKAMLLSHKFYENIKIGDNKKGHAKFKEEFIKLMTKDQHSLEDINNLLKPIYQ